MKPEKIKSKDLPRLSVEAYKAERKIPVVVILDNIRSGHNVGSFFRTMDGFRLEKIILGGITPTPPNKEIAKAALGAIETVDWVHENNLVESIRNLKNDGYKIIAIEQCTGSKLIHEFDFSLNKKLAIVFGNEVKGVSQELIDNCDMAIEIPMIGTKHSFNVSVSGGIVLWEAFKALK